VTTPGHDFTTVRTFGGANSKKEKKRAQYQHIIIIHLFATMTELVDTFQALLESEDGGTYQEEEEEDALLSVEERQGRLCETMTRQLKLLLQQEEDQVFPANALSIRQALSGPGSNNNNNNNNNTNKISELTSVVGTLLGHRVDPMTLLPATQDVEANTEVLQGNAAMTLTLPALQAAHLYVLLLQMPGALGAGLIELESLQALVALVRRWSAECCGRESEFMEQTNNHNNDNTRNSRNKQTSTKSPPKKRSRRGPVILQQDDDDDFGEVIRNASPSTLQMGFQVATALLKVPEQREVPSWSTEAREALLDAVMTAFYTCAAFDFDKQQQSSIIQQANESLQQCLAHTQMAPQRHETSVVILRALLPVINFKQLVPNGERGKLQAHGAAVQTLQALIQSATETIENKTLADASNVTPRRRRRKSGALTPATITTPNHAPKSIRKNRLSVDGTTPMLSPALKGRRQSGGLFLSSPIPSDMPKPRPVLSALLGMLQKMATSPGLERASVRGPTAQSILKCLPSLPHLERSHFLRYLIKLCNSKLSVHRLVGCELIGSVLNQEWFQTNHKMDANHPSVASPQALQQQQTPQAAIVEPDLLPAALLKALQGRLLDRIAAVRVRAAISLEAALESNHDHIDETILASLRKRATKDETAMVRKAAISTLTKLLLQKQEWFSTQDLNVLCQLTHDTSLLTRKAAAENLTTLLERMQQDHPMAELLEQSWSTCVLPMLLDDETACSTKAIQSFDRVVITPILENTNHQATARGWRLLAHVSNSSGQQGASKGEAKALQAALKQLAADDWSRIYNQLLERMARVAYQTLPTHTDRTLEYDSDREAQLVGVWCLLDALIGLTKDMETITDILADTAEGLGFVVTAWETFLHYPLLKSTLRSSLLVVTKLAAGLDKEAAKKCAQSLERELQNFTLPVDVIGAAIAALASLATILLGARNPEQIRKNCSTWIQKLYSRCEDQVALFVQEASSSDATVIDTDQRQPLVRALFTVGELSMVGFRVDDDERDVATHQNEDSNDVLRRLNERPSKRLQELVLTMLPHQLPGHKTPTPGSIRAHAFTVLGKLCLRDEALAKTSLNLLARELHPSAIKTASPAVQSNTLLVLGDLCVRYTNMADRYLPVMASCLQAGTSDPDANILNLGSSGSAIVRKHAVLLLSSLLLQDYIKWRGLLFHRFLVATSDEDEGVAHLAGTVLCGPLWLRNPKLFFNHFVEALFVLNRCTAHPIYVAAATMGDGGSGIAVGFEGIQLRGSVGEARRHGMYEFLLSKMSDEEKIGVTARLAKEVLGGALNSQGDLGRVCQRSTRDSIGPTFESAWNVMTDAFYILTSKAIKVGKAIQEEDDIEDPNVPNPSRQVSIAKGRLLSKISRKHMIEIVLPILCNLKTLLHSSCSPLLKDLMNYMLDIFKNYKVEVKEFLATDPTLLQEIEYDARQHSQQNTL
jgi:condensin-2 complex subunit D3